MEQSRRRKILASVAVVAVAASAAISIDHATNTDASFVDRVFGTGVFDVDYFNIEGAANPGTNFADHTAVEGAARLEGSTAPGTITYSASMEIRPTETTYVPFYLRTKTRSNAARTVTMSPATKMPSPASDAPLWNTYVTYGARLVDPATTPTCNAAVFSGSVGTQLVPQGSAMGYQPSTTFTLPAATTSAPGAARMICFAFTLDQSVKTGSPDSNGKSIYPYWSFVGQS